MMNNKKQRYLIAIGAGIVLIIAVLTFLLFLRLSEGQQGEGDTVDSPTSQEAPAPEISDGPGYAQLNEFYEAKERLDNEAATQHLTEAEAAFLAADDQEGLEAVELARIELEAATTTEQPTLSATE
jgi:hypothetical protein